MPTGVYVRTQETREILSRAKTGTKLSEAHKENIRKSLIGKNLKHGKPKCPVCGKQLANYRNRYCILHWGNGERNPQWKGGSTPTNRRKRFKAEYKVWRTAVFERDDFTCQACGRRGVELNAHHIKPWADFPELRYAVENGMTLCVPCHKKARRKV